MDKKFFDTKKKQSYFSYLILNRLLFEYNYVKYKILIKNIIKNIIIFKGGFKKWTKILF